MNHYGGIDVSLKSSSVCIVDGTGKIVREAAVESEPATLIGWFKRLGVELERIGLEAGPLSQWLYAARRVRTAPLAAPVVPAAFAISDREMAALLKQFLLRADHADRGERLSEESISQSTGNLLSRMLVD